MFRNGYFFQLFENNLLILFTKACNTLVLLRRESLHDFPVGLVSMITGVKMFVGNVSFNSFLPGGIFVCTRF